MIYYVEWEGLIVDCIVCEDFCMFFLCRIEDDVGVW